MAKVSNEDILNEKYPETMLSDRWAEFEDKKKRRTGQNDISMSPEEHQAYLQRIQNRNYAEMPVMGYDQMFNLVVSRLKKEIPGDRKIWVDDRNKETCRRLIKYFLNLQGWRNPDGEWIPGYHEGDKLINVRKSIVIEGNVGTGKTTFVRVINSICRDLQNEYKNLKSFYFIDYTKLVEMIEEKKDTSIPTMHYRYDTIYDDFAHAGLDAHVAFRGKTGLVERIVRNHYTNKRKPLKIYITNHSKEDFQKIYGDAILGRMADLCEWIVWRGKANILRPGSVVKEIGQEEKF